MKNTMGQSVCVTLFGESHGPEIGAVLDGLAPGIPVDEAYIAEQLRLRRPAGRISTARQEADPFRIVSGVFEGRTTGTPITLLIPNGDTRSGDYARGPARPGHADYTAWVKYHGFEDYRGGGHFSGRITAALVAAGAIARLALSGRGITLGSRIARCAGVADAEWTDPASELPELIGSNYSAPDSWRVLHPGPQRGCISPADYAEDRLFLAVAVVRRHRRLFETILFNNTVSSPCLFLLLTLMRHNSIVS